MDEQILKKEEKTLREYLNLINQWLKYIFSNWIYIILASLIGMFIGYYLVKNKKPLYEAQITFVLENAAPSTGGGVLTLLFLH